MTRRVTLPDRSTRASVPKACERSNMAALTTRSEKRHLSELEKRALLPAKTRQQRRRARSRSRRT